MNKVGLYLINVNITDVADESDYIESIGKKAAAEAIKSEKGRTDAILAEYEAEAKSVRQLLDSKASGYQSLVESCDGDARAAVTLLMIEKLEEIVGKQVEAVSELKIDKNTVWDTNAVAGTGSSTANFVSGSIRSLPPLQDVAAMAGMELPSYLGSMAKESALKAAEEAPPSQIAPTDKVQPVTETPQQNS